MHPSWRWLLRRWSSHVVRRLLIAMWERTTFAIAIHHHRCLPQIRSAISATAVLSLLLLLLLMMHWRWRRATSTILLSSTRTILLWWRPTTRTTPVVVGHVAPRPPPLLLLLIPLLLRHHPGGLDKLLAQQLLHTRAGLELLLARRHGTQTNTQSNPHSTTTNPRPLNGAKVGFELDGPHVATTPQHRQLCRR